MSQKTGKHLHNCRRCPAVRKVSKLLPHAPPQQLLAMFSKPAAEASSYSLITNKPEVATRAARLAAESATDWVLGVALGSAPPMIALQMRLEPWSDMLRRISRVSLFCRFVIPQLLTILDSV